MQDKSKKTKSVTDIQNQRTYILDAKTNEILTSSDFEGNYYDKNGNLLGNLND